MEVDGSMNEIKSDIQTMNELVTNTIVNKKSGSLKSDVLELDDRIGALEKKFTKDMDEIKEMLKVVTNKGQWKEEESFWGWKLLILSTKIQESS